MTDRHVADRRVAKQVSAVRARITDAASRAGRDPADVTLVAVTKAASDPQVRAVVAAGVRHLGENRVGEAQARMARLEAIEPDPCWHMVGHLQRNKAKRALAAFDRVDSVDSLRLARRLDRLAREADCRLPVLLQVNSGDDPDKYGFGLAAAEPAAREIVGLAGLDVRGLMTIAPLVDDPEDARPAFRRLAALRARLADRLPEAGWAVLSMGMTNDFEVAVEEGATEVRVGRALFAKEG